MDPTTRVEVLRAACCVAGADGKAKPEELALLQRLADDVGVGKASFDAMVSRGEEDQNFYQKQFAVLKADPQQTMAILFQIAMADGQISEAETGILRGLADNLNVPEDIFNGVLEQSRNIL